MVGYLQFAQLVRTANARIRSARDLEQRWKALGPEGQAEARVELDRLTAALRAVRDRIAAGPRGFVREFKSAYRGEESAPIAEPASLGKLLGELHAASNALREKLDAVEHAATEQATPAPEEDGAEDTDAGADADVEAEAEAETEAGPAPRSGDA